MVSWDLGSYNRLETPEFDVLLDFDNDVLQFRHRTLHLCLSAYDTRLHVQVLILERLNESIKW